ncbi:MAG: glycosyltransferase family 4 protein, partial [Methylobacteriaceae bacterium]|nr:glycosyltransferase family 4 protein [Methylobacteriaceae bacterium]
VVEAFAHGVPVVSTETGMQGIPEPGRFAAIANDPADFAAAILRTARGRPEAVARARAALAFMRERYTSRRLAELVGPLLTSRPFWRPRGERGRAETAGR